VRDLESSALPLGIVPGQIFETNFLVLAPGELLVGFSDGITEAMNQAGEPYGDRRLVQAIQAHADEPAQTLVQTITRLVDEFVAGAPQADDMTMLIVKRVV
jgi:sigma-B regulation protein RsbU (phosphoserine phosphatase)